MLPRPSDGARRRPALAACAAAARLGLGLTSLGGPPAASDDAVARLGVQARPRRPHAGRGPGDDVRGRHVQRARQPAHPARPDVPNGKRVARLTASIVRAQGASTSSACRRCRTTSSRCCATGCPTTGLARRTLGRSLGAAADRVAARCLHPGRPRAGSTPRSTGSCGRCRGWSCVHQPHTGRRIFVIDTHNSPARPRGRARRRHRPAARADQPAARHQAGRVLPRRHEREARDLLPGRQQDLAARRERRQRGPKRDCTLPEGRLHIDWIFGAGPRQLHRLPHLRRQDVRRASDHSFIRAQVTLRPRRAEAPSGRRVRREFHLPVHRSVLRCLDAPAPRPDPRQPALAVAATALAVALGTVLTPGGTTPPAGEQADLAAASSASATRRPRATRPAPAGPPPRPRRRRPPAQPADGRAPERARHRSCTGRAPSAPAADPPAATR